MEAGSANTGHQLFDLPAASEQTVRYSDISIPHRLITAVSRLSRSSAMEGVRIGNMVHPPPQLEACSDSHLVAFPRVPGLCDLDRSNLVFQ